MKLQLHAILRVEKCLSNVFTQYNLHAQIASCCLDLIYYSIRFALDLHFSSILLLVLVTILLLFF